MTAPLPSNPIVVGLAGLPAGRSDEELLDLLTPQGRQAVIVAALAAHAQKINQLEVGMAQHDEQLAAVSANLDNVSGDVEWLHTEVVRLQNEAQAKDSEFAAALQPLVDKTAELAGRTPDRQPEPTPEPEPAPEV